MEAKTLDPPSKITDIRQLGDTVEEIMAALEDPEIFDLAFGEPSDEEIAEAIRQAEVEYAAGDYKPTPLDDDDDEPYRTPMRHEILEGIKQGYKEALAGDVITWDELMRRLKDSDS